MKLINLIQNKTAGMFAFTLLILVAVTSCKKKDTGSAAAANLKVQVITASLNGFSVNSTLVYGDHDAILIDAQLLNSDADVLAQKIKATGKNLTTIYITHSHPDHYFGLVELKKAFPNAKIVALPAVVADMNKTWRDKVATLKPGYGDDLTSNPIIPDVLNSNTLTLEDQQLQIFGNVQGDEENNSYVWIPSIKTVVTGDVDYSGVFPWTLETTPAQRVSWINALNNIAALNPAVVIPGHQNPALNNDPSSIPFTQGYLSYYDSVLPTATSSAQFQSIIVAHYPSLIVEAILQTAADAAFPKK